MSDLQSIVLNSTNTYRTIYQAEPVTWNKTLATFAANHAQDCIFHHSGGPYGENLAGNYPSPTLAIDAWADEERHYSYKKKKFTEKNGHFTQLVWLTTTDVGCANIECGDGDSLQGDYLVCEYYPRGNVVGEFGENVMKAGKKSIGSGAAGRKGAGMWWIGILCVGLVVGLW